MAASLLSQQTARLPTGFNPFKEEHFNFPKSQLTNIRDLKYSSVGNFSLLRLAELKEEKTTVALKTLTQEEGKEVYGLVELALLKNLDCQHVISFVGAFHEEERMVLITDFLERGDLKTALEPDLHFFQQQIHASDLDFVWKQRVRVAVHISSALNHLHSLNIVHRDIKSENIFLTGRGRKTIVKLGDFGFARGIHSIEEDLQRSYTLCGTDHLMAPEMLQGLPYDHSVDIFSFGCVLVELLCGRGPSEMTVENDMVLGESEDLSDVVQNLDEDLKKIRKIEFLKRTPRNHFEIDAEEINKYALAGSPKDLLNLTALCLEYESKYRISASDLNDDIKELETNLNLRNAERLPSKVERSKHWQFDRERGTFICKNPNFEGLREENPRLSRVESVYDLVDPKSLTKNMSKKALEGSFQVNTVSEYSNTKSLANAARRQLRQISRTLTMKARKDLEVKSKPSHSHFFKSNPFRKKLMEEEFVESIASEETVVKGSRVKALQKHLTKKL